MTRIQNRLFVQEVQKINRSDRRIAWLAGLLVLTILIGFTGMAYWAGESNRTRVKNISRVTSGMTEAEVRQLLGEPERIEQNRKSPLSLAMPTSFRSEANETMWVYSYRKIGLGSTLSRKQDFIYFRDGKVSYHSDFWRN